jgi:outer membrane biosynthesis protein TonB
MAIAMPKLELPKIERKTALIAAGVVVALAVGGWFAWTTFMAEPPPPPPKPVAAKPKPAPAPAPAPAPVVVAVPVPAPAPVVESKPAAPEVSAPAPRHRSRAREDARECLAQPTDARIAACAEKFR